MATVRGASKANMHCRKRSFDLVTEHSEQSIRSHQRPTLQNGFRPYPVTSRQGLHPSPTSSSPKRRLRTIPPSPTMPVHIASSVVAPLPTFMSVYDSDDLPMDREYAEISQPKEPEAAIGQLNINSPNTLSNHPLPYPIYHRDSVASIATNSSTSSPATNQSSPLFTDPSPSSSPESASSSNPPLSPFANIMQTSNHDRQSTGDSRDQGTQVLQMPPSTFARPASPTRNVKNLSLNMNTAVNITRPATSHGAESRMNALSVPVSPLKEPLRSARKKPTNLTIRTPGFNQMSFPRGAAGDVPPTPSSRPTLPTLQSSPSLPSLQTPTTSGSSGLHLSLPSFSSGHSRPGSDSSFSSHQSASLLPGLREEDEPRRSFEAPERGYPEGPIKIYDCGVWLYLEPKAEEAKDFDTVINVAKEIKNPFENNPAEKDTVMSVWRSNRNSMIEPQTAMSEFSFKSAWEFQPADATPTTPRPASAVKNDPEYLHVPWDHNSEILEDLWPLCRVIDERVKADKKVLIHCQLGVSRSASLVIAYGLFKGYQRDFHSMYQQVKSKSRWVGPNMSLIYQLSDFRANIEKGFYTDSERKAPSQWFKYSPPDSLSFKNPRLSYLHHESDASASPETDPSTTPIAKPLRSLKLDKELPPVPLFPKEEKKPIELAQRHASAGPPKSNAAPPTPPRNEPAAKKQSVEPRPLPFRKLAEYSNPAAIPPHRPKVGVIPASPARLHVSRPSMDLAYQDVPETPSLFSPRATEFLASPFSLRAGELAIGSGPKSARSMKSIPPPTPSPGFVGFTHIRAPTMQETPAEIATQVPVAIDPRSPHQLGEPREILRHIDDFL